MRALLRLAGWGTAAAAALIFAVIAGYSSNGQQRLSIMAASLTGKGAPAKSVADAAAAQQKRIVETENQTRQLAEMFDTLNSDRERLLSRVAVLERNLADVTGTIKQRETPFTIPEQPAPPASDPPAEPPATESPVESAPPPIAATAEPTLAPKSPPETRVATVTLHVTPPPESEPEAKTGPAIGIDIGGASNFDSLRKLWASASSAHPALFDGLQPIVAVRENSKTRTADLRLVVGPLPDTRAAVRICDALAVTKHYCRQAPFEGRQFSLLTPDSPRRPKAAGRKKSRSSSWSDE